MARLFRTTDADEADAILDRFRVDYVLEYAPLRLRFDTPRLVEVDRRDGVRVLWVARRSRPRPEPVAADVGLR